MICLWNLMNNYYAFLFFMHMIRRTVSAKYLMPEFLLSDISSQSGTFLGWGFLKIWYPVIMHLFFEIYRKWEGNQKFFLGVGFFTRWREPEEEWFWWFKPFSKLKTAFCEYWTSIKIKVNMACVVSKSIKLKQKSNRSNDYS